MGKVRHSRINFFLRHQKIKSYFGAKPFEKVIHLLHVIAIEWLAAIESAEEAQSAWV